MNQTLGPTIALLALLGGASSPAAAAAPQINACELLTPAEISATIGLPVDAGRRHDEGVEPDGQYSSSCIWMIEPAKPPDRSAPLGGRRFVILNAMQWPAGRGLARKFLQAFRDSADKGVIASRPSPREFGDEALWWGDGLAVRKGDMSFGISVFNPQPNAARTSTLEEKLAPHVLRRIEQRAARTPMRDGAARR